MPGLQVMGDDFKSLCLTPTLSLGAFCQQRFDHLFIEREQMFYPFAITVKAGTAIELIHSFVIRLMGAAQIGRHQVGVVKIGESRVGVLGAGIEDGLGKWAEFGEVALGEGEGVVDELV